MAGIIFCRWPAAACLLAAPLAGHSESGPAEQGATVACTITEVYDGDTVTIEFRVAARVRLLDCWAPEIRTRDAEEKRRGLAARDHLAKVCGMVWDEEAKRWRGRTPAVIAVPFGRDDDLGSVFTMGRLLGSVTLEGDHRTLAERQRNAGHAEKTKEGPQ